MKDMAWQTASKYSAHMEEMRSRLLSKPSEERVLKFYTYHQRLLPATKSPVRDKDIADYANERGLAEENTAVTHRKRLLP